jgi:hypothetical protein
LVPDQTAQGVLLETAVVAALAEQTETHTTEVGKVVHMEAATAADKTLEE